MFNVMIFHALTVPHHVPSDSGILTLLHQSTPHLTVIFIVLSGYCLMLPLARSSDGELRGGVTGFIRRRALRILPAYYIVLLACIALVYAMTLIGLAGTHATSLTDSLSLRHVVTHLLLIHNWSFDTAYSLNGTMWTVATEWQIYFVFALLLLPLWRRFGILTAAAVAFGLGLLPHLLLPMEQSFYWARPWNLGMFAIGMVAACVDFRPESRDLAPFRRLSRGLPLLAGVFLAGTALLHVTYGLRPTWEMDTLVALCTALLISNCVRASRDGSTGGGAFGQVRHFLSHPTARKLASFSYTAYLIQHIVFKACSVASGMLHLSASGYAIVAVLVGIPSTLFAASCLSKYIERPFASSRGKEKTTVPEATSTAPWGEPAQPGVFAALSGRTAGAAECFSSARGAENLPGRGWESVMPFAVEENTNLPSETPLRSLL